MLNILATAVATIVAQRNTRKKFGFYASDAERAAERNPAWNTMLPGNLPPEPLSVLIDATLSDSTPHADELRRRAR